jgi:hypothetical protein
LFVGHPDLELLKKYLDKLGCAPVLAFIDKAVQSAINSKNTCGTTYPAASV